MRKVLFIFLFLIRSSRPRFNPEVFERRDAYNYVNDPILNASTDAGTLVLPIESPSGLLHRPASLQTENSVVGLAMFSFFFAGFQRLVGSLRAANFTGNIILGVSPSISKAELAYLKSYDVTMFAVETADCDQSIYKSAPANSATDKRVGGGLMRGRCIKGLEHLKIEMGRFELARQWISDCSGCTGWTLVMDTRDAFFQRDPLVSLGDAHTASVDLMFIEEIAPHTSPVKDRRRSFVAGNVRNEIHTVPCYGRELYDKYAQRPVLNSGSVIGTRQGIMRFLNVLVDEFISKALDKKKPKCRSPFTTDQWTMNWLYYAGRFGRPEHTVTIPWGMGPVQTLGKVCVSADKKLGAGDLVQRGPDGLIVNRFDGQVAALIHQFDRCGEWIRDFMRSRPDMFARPAL
jgi:hypothetical protein